MTVVSGVRRSRSDPPRDLNGVMAAAHRTLASWTASPASTTGSDLGPVVLATLIDDASTQQTAVRAWLRTSRQRTNGVGLFGGTAGILAGLRLLADKNPSAGPAAERAAASLSRARSWRTRDVAFTDYDLVSGPAGVLLAHTTGGTAVHHDHVATIVDHLAAAADVTLSGLRIGAHAGHPLLDWTQGGVVTGLAHGVAGAVAALSLAPPSATTIPAIRNMSRWLVLELAVDGLGVASWPRRGPANGWSPSSAEPRQAWCYGNPGVSWALWTAGQALTRANLPDGQALCEIATAAIRTLCAGYDTDLHLDDDQFSVCHGAAGVMLIADAFARHADLPEAAALRDRLAGFLQCGLPDVVRLGDSDMSLLTGAPGVLAALLTVGGADRGWLRCLALS